MSRPWLAQGAGEAGRLCLRAGEVAAERGRGGACQACAAPPLARLARHVEAGGLRSFCAKPRDRLGRRPPCALSRPERQGKARDLAAPLALLAVPRLCSRARPSPQPAVRSLSLALVVIFLPVIALRVFAAYNLLRRAPAKRARPRLQDAELPVYTILVPLYREANMLASLTSALARLDYPAAKLDIKLVLEAVDVETVALARKLQLPGNVEIVVVPDLHPRTKPKALNYALPLARGEYLVTYDAEDRPERDQLRKAIAAFQEGPPNLACLQAKLNLYNASDNWLTRQFTIEYDALFEGSCQRSTACSSPSRLAGRQIISACRR